MEDTGKLPMGELSAGSGTDKKTMERHRKYLVAILLALSLIHILSMLWLYPAWQNRMRIRIAMYFFIFLMY